MSRKCPFDQCGQRISSEKFGCSRHWYQLTQQERNDIWEAYRNYQRGELTLRELSDRQQSVLAAWRKRQK